MRGSTFIAESDRSKLAAMESVEDLDAFTYIGLERMMTIDFEVVLAAAKVEWTEGQPVRFSEEEGVGIFKISEAGLKYVVDHIADFPMEHQADLRLLADFVKKYGTLHIYELATF